MAFTSVLRRSASVVTPLVGRLLSGQRNFHHHCGGALFYAMNHTRNIIISNNSSLVASFPRYCSSAISPVLKPQRSDESLLKVLESEIKCSEESFEEEDEGFPEDFPFQLHDIAGQKTVTLTREYEGETINIEVEPSDLITGNIDDSSTDEESEKEDPSALPMVVKVSKSDGPSLEFEITAHPDEIVIDSLTVNRPDFAQNGLGYEGPRFDELDENMQKEFYKYLEKRGVKANLMKFLHEYTVNKDHREYTNWVKAVKEFVEA